MAVHWLRHYASIAGGAWVQALVPELRSHKPWGVAKKKKEPHSLDETLALF